MDAPASREQSINAAERGRRALHFRERLDIEAFEIILNGSMPLEKTVDGI